MLDKQWSFNGGTPLRDRQRPPFSADLKEPGGVMRPDDTVRLDGSGNGSSRSNGYGSYTGNGSYRGFSALRRPAAVATLDDSEFGDRDAFAATALASLQSADGDASVLDVDGAELAQQVALLPPRVVPEDTWTPPTLTTPPPLSADPVIQALSSSAEPLPEIGRRQRSEARQRSSLPILSVLTGVVVLIVLGLLVAGLYVMLTEPGDTAAADQAPERAETAPAAPEDEAAEDAGAPVAAAPVGAEQLANVEGVLQLTNATLRPIVDGQPGEPATSFAAGQKVSLWLAFDYTSRDESDNLGVAWFKEDQELTRSSFGLTSEVQMTAMSAPALEEPGDYRAEISLNDQVIHSVPFKVSG